MSCTCEVTSVSNSTMDLGNLLIIGINKFPRSTVQLLTLVTSQVQQTWEMDL